MRSTARANQQSPQQLLVRCPTQYFYSPIKECSPDSLALLLSSSLISFTPAHWLEKEQAAGKQVACACG